VVGRLAAAAGVVAIAWAVGACTLGRADRGRMLPEDASAPVLYVALGDSTVEGVAATTPEHTYVSRLFQRLRAVYPRARMVNLGQSGAVSAEVVSAQLPGAVALGPDLVTLSVGPNDITGGIGVDAYERHLDTIFGTLTRQTRAVVVVNLLPDLAVTPRFTRSDKREVVGRLTVEFNERVVRKAEEYGVSVVDLYAASRDEVPRRPELVAADGYHPSDLGYARWAELVWAAVEPRVTAR
jgi:lysophospholipase L1-like esterase